jgi:environmental stress-induced protein Ves
VRILKADDYRRTPWRNGLGETAEVAISPSDATLDDFDWRVSIARIYADGPFSIFPQTDRTLAILRGDGLQLSIADGASVELTRSSEPLAFPGDAPADATLLGGPVTDLNVMTRRGRLTHSIRRLRVDGAVDLAVDAPVVLLVCTDAPMRADVTAQTIALAPLDTLLVEGGPVSLRISSDIPAHAYLITVFSST